MYKIMIDPGHTSEMVNPGVISGYYEGDMVWKLSQYLISELQKYGFEVGCTKQTVNQALDVVPRGRMSRGYDMFISLHSDACGTESVDRVTVFHMVEDDWTDIDEKSRALARMLAPAIAAEMGTNDRPQVKSKAASGDRNGNGRHDDNWLGVLHGAHEVGTPGILIEHSFHTNRRSCEWLMDEAHLQQLAKVEAMVIAEYFGIEKQDQEFIDVPVNSWFHDAVEWARATGITSGVDALHFAPERTCTRAQAVTMLWASVGRPEPESTASFSDVSPDDYFGDAVNWAVEKGVTAGISLHCFGANETCTRGQMVTMLWAMAGKPSVDSNPFRDMSSDDYCYVAAGWAYNCGITAGSGNCKFSPDEACTRAQVVTMLHAYSKL